MWQSLIALALTGAIAQTTAFAQETRRPYGPFDAIAEGTARSEAQRLSLIESQLQTVNQLRLAEVAGPRAVLRDPGVAAVYPYGRRGLLGLRPRGYIVVRRPPATVYRRSYDVAPPPFESGYAGPEYSGYGVRQPIGHQLSQTGPNRWEYRPLYADDDPELDEMHRQIEQNLRPLDEDERAKAAAFAADDSRVSPSGSPREDVPEELPEPAPLERSRPEISAKPATNGRGGARDIARDSSQDNMQRSGGPARAAERGDNRAPPPPQPDPPDQPRNVMTNPANPPDKNDASVDEKPSVGEDELRGPLLQNPATGSREF